MSACLVTDCALFCCFSPHCDCTHGVSHRRKGRGGFSFWGSSSALIYSDRKFRHTLANLIFGKGHWVSFPSFPTPSFPLPPVKYADAAARACLQIRCKNWVSGDVMACWCKARFPQTSREGLTLENERESVCSWTVVLGQGRLMCLMQECSVNPLIMSQIYLTGMEAVLTLVSYCGILYYTCKAPRLEKCYM